MTPVNSDAAWEGEERRSRTAWDHDLLVSINTKLNAFIDNYNDYTEEKRLQYVDHEARIRFLERGIWGGFGALAILQIVLKFLKI